jgi:hypothetical protein
VSSSSSTALAVKYKTQVLSGLVAAYTQEVLKLLNDAEYKALPPSDQIAIQFELGHWYHRWFGLVPDPDKSSVDFDDYTTIPTSSEHPHAVASIRDGVISYFSDFIPVVRTNYGTFSEGSHFRPEYVDIAKTPHPNPM